MNGFGVTSFSGALSRTQAIEADHLLTLELGIQSVRDLRLHVMILGRSSDLVNGSVLALGTEQSERRTA